MILENTRSSNFQKIIFIKFSNLHASWARIECHLKFTRANVSDISASNSLYYSIRRALRVVKPSFAVITLMHPNARKNGRERKRGKREREGVGGKEGKRKKAVKVSVSKRREKLSHLQRVFEVVCPIALIELAISGPR